MSDAITNLSTLEEYMPTLVSDKTVYYYEKLRVFAGLLGEGMVFEVPSTAKAVTVPQSDYVTFAAGTEGADQESVAFTTTPRTVQPVVFSHSIRQSWLSLNSTPYSMDQFVDIYSQASAAAWAALEDDDATYGFAGLYLEAPSTGPDHELGTDGTVLDASVPRQIVQLLMTAGAKRPYHWVIDPLQFEELMRDAEFKQWAQQTQGNAGQMAATYGVNQDRYLCTIFGLNIWVANLMVASGGPHSMAFGQGAMCQGYKMYSNPLNTTPARMHMSIQYENQASDGAYRFSFRIVEHNTGAAWTATTNKFLIDWVS